MLIKTEVDCLQSSRHEISIQENVEELQRWHSLKGPQGNILSEPKKLFLPYCSDSTDNTVTFPSMDAAELVLKMIHRWSDQAKNEKAARAANLRLIHKMKMFHKELDKAKEEIIKLTKITLSDSGKGGELDLKL